MLRILPSVSYPTMSSHSHPSSQPKTPPSTPSLEKGLAAPRSTSKRSKPGLYYAHEITAYKRYTRCLHAIIMLLLLISLAVLWHVGGIGDCAVGGGGGGEGGLSFLPWMGSRMTKMATTVEKGVDTAAGTMADGSGDVVLAVQQCGVVLEEREEGCLRRFNGVAASSSMGTGEREAWREVRDGLEGLWRGLIESECKCHNPEMLDRMYEGLRERAGEMAGASGGVGELGG